MDYDASTAMSPKLVIIGNSCFRRLDCQPDCNITCDFTPRFDEKSQNYVFSDFNEKTVRNYLIDELEFEQNIDTFDTSEEKLEFNDGEELITKTDGTFEIKMHLCRSFNGYIIGKRGRTKIEIEQETNTKIEIPRGNDVNMREEINYIHIFSEVKKNVIKAFQKIRALEKSLRMKQDFTHFLSIPLVSESLKKKYLEFKTLVLSDLNCKIAKGIEESVFQSENRLHLTLRILYLGDLFERRLAIQSLNAFKQNFLDPLIVEKQADKIKLHIKGIDIMNDDPSDVNVLYAKVQEIGGNDLFKQIVNNIYDWFSSTGLVCDLDRNSLNDDAQWKVKIHATLMNIRYRKNFGDLSKSSKNHQKMDVTSILKKFGQFDFGEIQFDQIHLSTHNSYENDSSDYYLPLNIIKF